MDVVADNEGHSFWVYANHGMICIAVRKEVVTAPGRRTAEQLWACPERSYSFDPRSWTASVVGEFDTTYERQEEHWIGDTWYPDHSTWGEAQGPPVRLDLHWQGHGDIQPGADANVFLLPWARATATREAYVTGVLSIPTVNLTLQVPEQHLGRMQVHLPF